MVSVTARLSSVQPGAAELLAGLSPRVSKAVPPNEERLVIV